jgi:Cys-tRNA(Pro)/Cys-tRNA(Cys) deacylase
MMAKQEKTNVMRFLEQKKIPYQMHDYTGSGAIAGEDVARVLGENPDEVFKTLVTIGKSKQNYVFIVPVNKELNLKKAASAVGEKSIEMIKSKDLLGLTGYVHGGCSPIGMKKQFPTVVHNSAENMENILFSGGKIGVQVELKTEDFKKIINIKFADIAE